MLGGFVAEEQYERTVCVGQQGVVVDVFLEDAVPVVLKGISIGHSMGVVLILGYKNFELVRVVYIDAHLPENFEHVCAAEAYTDVGYLVVA